MGNDLGLIYIFLVIKKNRKMNCVGIENNGLLLQNRQRDYFDPKR